MKIIKIGAKALNPIIEKYSGKKHPLDYKNLYQLMIMVILSAQDSDANINKIAPSLFDILSKFKITCHVANVESLIPHISKVRNYTLKQIG